MASLHVDRMTQPRHAWSLDATSFDECEELIEYAIASYNGTPHGGLNNATLLEAIGYFARGNI
jgi:hypothetical protein